jgi:hypothetical protein
MEPGLDGSEISHPLQIAMLKGRNGLYVKIKSRSMPTKYDLEISKGVSEP